MNLWTILWTAALLLAALLVPVFREGSVFEPVAVLVLIAIVLALTIRTVVTVERHGIRARLGFFGFPSRFIAIDTVHRAVVVQVHPLRDYGGWGDRLRHGTRAFVARRGDALRVELVRGSAFEVTLDDARRAAERVNAFVTERGSVPARTQRTQRTRPRQRRPADPWF